MLHLLRSPNVYRACPHRLPDSILIFSFIPYTNAVRAATIPETFATSINSLCIWLVTFYLSYVMGKLTTRYEKAGIVNGNIVRLTALAVALYPPAEADAVVR